MRDVGTIRHTPARQQATSPEAQQLSAAERAIRRDGIVLTGTLTKEFAEILTPAALRFTAHIVRNFSPQRDALLERRVVVQKELLKGKRPKFLAETSHIREGAWRVAAAPPDLRDRRVEITGPAGDRKMVINALNSGANVYMADFEDAQSPTWKNVIGGQINLRDAIDRTIRFVAPDGKEYKLNDRVATLMMRPRGWHLPEKHILIDGLPAPAAMVDFCLYFFHNARRLIYRGSGPYFYLPKMESHLEARLWHDIFKESERQMGLDHGTIRATVLIETILAAFEMDEILFELREYSAGLNCGRWDYIFSFIKKFRNERKYVLPDRASVTMDKGFLSAYSRQLIKTCHRRGAHAMGGMAAQIPVRSDPEADRDASAKVRADKEREVREGHDGTWVAHPGLVPIARAAFDALMPGENQIGNLRGDVNVGVEDLLAVPAGTITEKGIRTNVSVGIQYLESWLRGIGAVPISHLMEDAATAEISRAQLWQWLRHGMLLEDRRRVTRELMESIIGEEMDLLRTSVGPARFDAGEYLRAAILLRELVLSKDFTDFLTLPAYNNLHSTTER